MYLARRLVNNTVRYSLRESYRQGDHWLSRELVDLGTDPRRLFHYPGGYAFLLDEAIEERLDELGVVYDPDDLERLLLPFVRSDIRARVERFMRPRSTAPFTPEEEARVGCEVHLFDRRRLHYLRYGAVDQGQLFRMPAKMCRVLLNKSRDELEQWFMDEEGVLEPGEWKTYVYVILDLQRFFEEIVARAMPSALPEEKLGTLAEEEFCRLQGDAAFWNGMPTTESLHPYLVRYLIMFFDSGWSQHRADDEYVRRFINSHRRPQSPPSHKVKMAEAAKLFGVEWKELQKMGRRQLIRLYRQRAHALHPDKGGKAEEFAVLTEVYRKLLRRK